MGVEGGGWGRKKIGMVGNEMVILLTEKVYDKNPHGIYIYEYRRV